MPSVFDFQSYVQYLQALVKHREQRGKTRAELAAAMECQAAYFSQVLKGKADSTEDQLAKLCEFLSLNERETEYLLTLLRIAKAGSNTLKRHLLSRAEEMTQAAERLENKISGKKKFEDESMRAYYAGDWRVSAIHMATACREFHSVKAISAKFNFPQKDVEAHLSKLESYGLVKFEKGEWHHVGGTLHFVKGSPYERQFQFSRRLMALQSLDKAATEDIHYAAIFCSTPSTRKQLRSRILKFLEEMHRDVEPTESKDVYALTLDFFNA